MIKGNLPKIIEEIWFDFSRSVEKVWNLNIPIEKISIEELEWHFEIPFWNSYNLKPNDVIKFPEQYKDEYDRIIISDISYPIDIMENKGRRLILDWLHRLVKLKILGKTEIQVRKIPREKIPEIIK